MEQQAYTLSFCGDSHILMDYGQVRSVAAGVKSVLLRDLINEEKLPGVRDMVPCNSSLLIRFDPDAVKPEVLKEDIRTLVDNEIEKKENIKVSSRIIDIPVYFADPWTKAAIDEYCEKVKPKMYDVDYIIQENRLKDLDELIHYLTTPLYMVVYLSVGPGLPSTVCLDPKYVLSIPKYNPPRTSTPPLSIGLGGSNVSLYPTSSPGGFQLFGMLPCPLFDPKGTLQDFKETPVLARVGDRFHYRSVSREEFDEIVAECRAGTWRYSIEEAEFDLTSYEQKEGVV